MDVVINYEDTTFRRTDATLARLCQEYPVVNSQCRDISKRHVDEVFGRVFGYSASIDPLTYHGPCVKKSNVNARHDGVILSCPLQRVEEESVYQIVINNQLDEEYVLDIRVPVFKEVIPFAYLKKRPVATRFSNTNTLVTLTEVHVVLS